MTPKRIVIIGAAGFARETRWLIRDINSTEEQYIVVGFVVSDLGRVGSRDSRAEIVGDLSWLDANRRSIDAVAIGIGTPEARIRVWRDVCAVHPDADLPPLVHPSAVLDRATTTIGLGAQVCAGAVLSVNVTLGALALCNCLCFVGHESVVGEASVIYPGTTVSGGVVIGKGVVVGTGARILQYCKVGDHATVGAGSVVVCNVDKGATVFGIPARPIAASPFPEGAVEQGATILSPQLHEPDNIAPLSG